MFPNRLICLGLLLFAAGRFTAEALSSEEKGFLEIARAAALKTFGQDTLHETVSVKTSDSTGFTIETTGDRVQQKNADGGRDVYATLTDTADWFGFIIAQYTMDYLVFKDVAWARLVKGEYFEDIPAGWFKPAEHGLDDLQDLVMDQYYIATGALELPLLLDQYLSSIGKAEDSGSGSQCFKYTLTEDVAASDVESRTICEKGGLIVSFDRYLEITKWDQESGSEVTITVTQSIVFSEYGKPVTIPDPTQTLDLKRRLKRVRMAGTSLGYDKLGLDA